MVFSLAACGKKEEAPAPTTQTPQTSTPTPAAPAPEAEPMTLVVGYSPFNSKFSPFFNETAYDQDVYAMTQVSLLGSDRTGAVLLNGIEGDTVNYNGTDYTYYGIADCVITENADGTVDYDFTLRDDVVFSDGEKLTADDVIFTMYVYADPTYDGSSTFFAQPIVGMEEYRSGMDSRGNAIFAAGDGPYVENDAYTQDQYEAFWEYYHNKAGADFAQEIVDYCI
ncbi:MAG: ABC transporter substrate-binding protein, partial [Firmicutes bacterium]|nr:ABC transporter substrate-binding protein [Bacillota bacterium]